MDTSRSGYFVTLVKLRVINLPGQLQLPVQAAEDLLVSIHAGCMEGRKQIDLADFTCVQALNLAFSSALAKEAADYPYRNQIIRARYDSALQLLANQEHKISVV